MGLEFDRAQPWVKTTSKIIFDADSAQVRDENSPGEDHGASEADHGRPISQKSSDSACHSHAREYNHARPSTSSQHSNAAGTGQDFAHHDWGGQLSAAESSISLAPLNNPEGASNDSATIGIAYRSPLEPWVPLGSSSWPLSPGRSTVDAADMAQPALIASVETETTTKSPLRNEAVQSSHLRPSKSITSPQTLSAIYLDTPIWPLRSKQEAELMRYYIERLARKFDLTDPQMHFRNVVPQRAAICPLLLSAIFALSARHMSRVGEYDSTAHISYHQQCLESVKPVLDDPAALLDENLLASTIILRHLEEIEIPLEGCSPPDSQPHLLGSRVFIEAQRHVNVSHGLGGAAFWVGLRQEIYVAFVNQRTIATALGNLSVDLSTPATGDHDWSCRMVALCADVIRYCYGDGDKSTSAYDKLTAMMESWDSGKSHSFTPIYYRAASDQAVLPEVWLLSDVVILGWQHYYIAKLLLTANNPRVPGLGPIRTTMLRAIDDELRDIVKLLCGIAMSNPNTEPNFT